MPPLSCWRYDMENVIRYQVWNMKLGALRHNALYNGRFSGLALGSWINPVITMVLPDKDTYTTESTPVLASQCKNFLYWLASTEVVNFSVSQWLWKDWSCGHGCLNIIGLVPTVQSCLCGPAKSLLHRWKNYNWSLQNHVAQTVA